MMPGYGYGYGFDLIGGGGGLSPYLLGNYPGADLALSLRKVNPDYSGPLVTLRRDSDNAEKSFYPDIDGNFSLLSEDGSSNDVATWVGANSAYVKEWHDQSGNGNDLTNTNTAQQSKIIDSGAMVTVNGTPAFGGTVGGLMDLDSALPDGDYWLFSVAKRSANTNFVLFSQGTKTLGFGLEGSTSDMSNDTTLNGVYKDGQSLGATYTRNDMFNAMGSQSIFIIDFNGMDTAGLDRFGYGSTYSFNYFQEVIIYNSDQSANRAGIESDINSFYSVYWDGTQTGLFDDYSGAYKALSMRALDSSYTDFAIRVRRSSDSDELDIRMNFDGTLDATAIESFSLGADDVFITSFYDQSGNAQNATATTANKQAMIADAGTVLLLNGTPVADFQRSADTWSDYGSVAAVAQPFTSFAVATKDGVQNNAALVMGQNGSNARRIFAINATPTLYTTFGTSLTDGTGSLIKQKQTSLYALVDGVGSEIGHNGSLDAGNAGTGEIVWIRIGTYSGSSYPYDGKFQEFIIYNSDQSANRAGIDENINTYYNMYWDGSKTGILDDHADAAVAYGLKALNSAYTGPMIRVRRDSDGEELDIYALFGGELDTGAIETFCASTDGYITTWYDQSGAGADATQATGANQQLIALSGVVNVNPDTLEPAGESTNATFYTMSNAAVAQPWSVFMGGYRGVWSSFIYLFRGGNILEGTNGTVDFSAGTKVNGTTAGTNNSNTVVYAMADGANSEFADYGVALVSGDVGSNDFVANETMFGRDTGTTGARGEWQSMILFSVDKSATWETIKADIETLFNY